MPIKILRAVGALALSLAAGASCAAGQTIELSLKNPAQESGRAIRAELADTPRLRQQGLMLRPSLPADQGMLFDLEQADTHCFWMKNTLIALSVAFIDQNGVISAIADMQPLSLEPHCSPPDTRGALEMNQKWFDEAGIRPGATISKTDGGALWP